MFWGAWVLVVGIARAGVVVSLDDVKAERKVRAVVGTYASLDDEHHASIFYADGRLRMIQDVNRGQARLTLDVPNDLFAEPLEDHARDRVLGRHFIERSCQVTPESLEFAEFRTGWFRRFVELVSLHRAYGGLEIHREAVLERRGVRGFADWFYDRNDPLAWAVRVSEHMYLARISEIPMGAEEFARSWSYPPTRAPEPRVVPVTKILDFPVRRGCERNLEEIK